MKKVIAKVVACGRVKIWFSCMGARSGLSLAVHARACQMKFAHIAAKLLEGRKAKDFLVQLSVWIFVLKWV